MIDWLVLVPNHSAEDAYAASPAGLDTTHDRRRAPCGHHRDDVQLSILVKILVQGCQKKRNGTSAGVRDG
jgi:hypothetical protein